jgi:aminocarboxymuconate-semialdehyde decarboxylase
MLKIDMHTHILPPEMPNWTAKFGYGDFVWLKPSSDQAGKADMMKGNQYFRTIEENCWDADVRIKDYEQFNTQVQVVCTIPVMFSYWSKGADCLELSRFLNDHVANLQAKYPKNYVALGTIPMQDSQLAIQELHRLKNELNIDGIQIGSNINDKNLGDAEFFPIFQECEKLGIAIMIHPWEMMGFNSMEKYWLPWLVGMPAETSRAMCSLIFGGVLERLPNLRVLASHAGGSFIPTIGRIEHGFNCRPDLVAVDNNINPREYLGKFWTDCITHDIDLLKYILKVQGSHKVCLGTDYPFPLGDLEVGKFIEDSDIPKGDIENMFCNSILSWLDMDKSRFL